MAAPKPSSIGGTNRLGYAPQLVIESRREVERVTKLERTPSES